MHPPIDDKLHGCKNILLSDEFDWDPSENLFEISSMEDEYRTSSNFHRYINIVESRVPCAPLKIDFRYDLVIDGFDRAMENVSIGLAKELIVEILIIKSRFKRTRSGFANYTDKRHHEIIADILAINWGDVIDKAKRTLQ